MAVGGGLAGSIGIGKETAYGTAVAPTRFPQVTASKLARVSNFVQGEGLGAGRIVELGGRRVETYQTAAGTIDLDWMSNDMGLIFDNIMGSASTPVQIGTTTAYTLSTSLASPDNQNYMTIQQNVPDTAGVVHTYTYHGCKVKKAVWTASRTTLLTCSLDIDAQYEEEATTITAPAFTAGSVAFSALNMGFEMGTYGSEVALDCVRSCTVSVEHVMDTTRIYIGNTYKDEPVTNGFVLVTGSMTIDLVSTSQKAQVLDLYHTVNPAQQTGVSVIWDFLGANIGSSGIKNELNLNMTSVFFEGASPDLSGPGTVTVTVPFKGLIGAANNPVITGVLTSADS